MLIRNPDVTINANTLQMIGDGHLGRVFRNNVAIERRGEWEAFQLKRFQEEIYKPKMEGVLPSNFIRVQAGDLLDKAIVSNEILMSLMTILCEYEKTQDTPLYIISGNHDDSKTTTEVTSWDILAHFFKDSERVIFVKQWQAHVFPDGTTVLLVGWNITNSVAQAVLQAEDVGLTINAVVCHLDRISYGNDENVIPYDFLNAHGVALVVSGHEHKPYTFMEGNLRAIGTGSLLPYSHAEDVDDGYYVTYKGWESFSETYQAQGKNFFYFKHVRVFLEPEYLESFAELELDCLSLQVHKLDQLEELEVEGETQVVIESYNAKSIWKSTSAELAVPDEQSQLLWAEIEAKGIEHD